jgi:hypothetical protein
MSASETTLNLDDAGRRKLGQVYRLLLELAEEKAASSEDLPQEPAPPTAPDSAGEALSHTGG